MVVVAARCFLPHIRMHVPANGCIFSHILSLGRYLFYDTWNLLDTLTLSTVFLAFVFRLLGMREFGGPVDPGDYFFVAQFFLAVR